MKFFETWNHFLLRGTRPKFAWVFPILKTKSILIQQIQPFNDGKHWKQLIWPFIQKKSFFRAKFFVIRVEYSNIWIQWCDVYHSFLAVDSWHWRKNTTHKGSFHSTSSDVANFFPQRMIHYPCTSTISLLISAPVAIWLILYAASRRCVAAELESWSAVKYLTFNFNWANLLCWGRHAALNENLPIVTQFCRSALR